MQCNEGLVWISGIRIHAQQSTREDFNFFPYGLCHIHCKTVLGGYLFDILSSKASRFLKPNGSHLHASDLDVNITLCKSY